MTLAAERQVEAMTQQRANLRSSNAEVRRRALHWEMLANNEPIGPLQLEYVRQLIDGEPNELACD